MDGNSEIGQVNSRGVVMVDSHEIRSSSEEETIALGKNIGKYLKAGDIVLLIGDLGSGKTRLAKGIISMAVGISEDEVVSPTFILASCFEGKFPVYHMDLYRLEPDQLNGIGLEEAFESNGAVIVEWAEKMPEIEDALKVSIRYDASPAARVILLEWRPQGSWADRMTGILSSAEGSLSCAGAAKYVVDTNRNGS